MSHKINDAEILIDKMLDYYSVVTYFELALKLNVSQANISNWKIRNSVGAIKNKCKELGIYNDIFGDFKLSIQEEQINQKLSIQEEILIQKMMDYFNALTMKELSEKIGISQPAISQWKNRILYLQ